MFSVEKINKYFIDWEKHIFGYGYGTGEEYTLKALKDFMDCVGFEKHTTGYDYRKLEKSLGGTVAWLMINILCHADILEYGSSPRFGWLTDKGIALYNYLKTKTVDELCNLTNSEEEAKYFCYPDGCNCEELGQEKCNNPFY